MKKLSVHKPPGVVAVVTGGRVGVEDPVKGGSVSVGGIVAEVERPEQIPAVHPFLLSTFEALERK